MQAVREIVDAEHLTSFMNIPEDMRHIKVEIIVLPAAREKPVGMNPEPNDYADPALIPKEKNAWQMAVMENAGKGKYESRVEYT
jgi:hypothetical protein